MAEYVMKSGLPIAFGDYNKSIDNLNLVKIALNVFVF
jgi:hypothetical protein